MGPVYVLNPYGILREQLKRLKWAGYNSMSRLDWRETVNFGPQAAKQADAIVWQDEDEIGSESKHRSKNARKGIHGLIMALARYGAPKEKPLCGSRRLSVLMLDEFTSTAHCPQSITLSHGPRVTGATVSGGHFNREFESALSANAA